MSHFTVLVKVTAETLKKHAGDIRAAVASLMAPYQENNMGNCPKEYLEFVDQEEEYKAEYETGSATRVVMPDGRLLSCYDEEFRVAAVRTRSSTYQVPEHLEKREIPYKELYATLEEYVTEQCGGARDPVKQRYGYWENPNAKWDYWRIGGRWRGRLRVKEMAETAKTGVLSWEHATEFNSGKPHHDQPHTADLAAVRDIDFEGMDLEVSVRVQEFWDTVQVLTNAGLMDPSGTTYTLIPWSTITELSPEDPWKLDNVFHTLLRLGIVCREESAKNSEEQEERPPAYRQIPFTLEDLQKIHRHHWEFGTYAVLDEQGWHAKGEMGWFGSSSETAEESQAWQKSYVDRFIRNEKPDTVCVIVDCHI